MTQQEYLDAKSRDVYLRKRKNPTEPELRLYLHEVNFHCPLCGKELQSRNQKKLNEKRFQIAHIYPNSPTKEQYELLNGLERLGTCSESFENKIALCKDCHSTQDYHTTVQEYIKLLNIKKRALEATTLHDIVQNMSIEEQISEIVQKIKLISEKDIAQLNYTPVNITHKFYENELVLKTKVVAYINMYYTFIRDQFKAIDGKDHFIFDVLCQQIRSCFKKMETESHDKTLIFNELLEWIKNKTQSNSIETCEAVISYFVQQCEVFNEISE